MTVLYDDDIDGYGPRGNDPYTTRLGSKRNKDCIIKLCSNLITTCCLKFSIIISLNLPIIITPDMPLPTITSKLYEFHQQKKNLSLNIMDPRYGLAFH